MERSFARYLRHHRAQGSSEKTIASHVDSGGRLIAFLRDRGHNLRIDDLCVDDVEDWIADQRDRGLAQKTIHTRVVAVKAWTRWLVEEEWLPKDPLARLKRPKVDDKAKDTLSPDDVDQLLATCDRTTATGRRNFDLLLLLFSTGLRANELLSLHVSDIDWDKGLILTRRGKGGKFRVVPLTGKAEKALEKYLNHPKRPDSPHVFHNQRGGPMTYHALHLLCRWLHGKTGIRCNPHKWRHSAAITYLRSGGRVETLRSMLGHADFAMTMHYARMAGVDLTAAHETADPARRLKTRV